MRATYLICLGLSAGLAVSMSGCKDLDQCDDPGVVEACACAGNDPGARTCQPEYVWSACDCAAQAPDSGVTGGQGGMMTGGQGGMMTGGQGGMMTGGQGGMMTGGQGGMMTGGQGGMSGGEGGMMAPDGGEPDGMTGGMGGTEPDEPGYVACTEASVASDCSAGAECRGSDAPILGDALFVCAPACTTEADCPAAPAGGSPTVECMDGQCMLTCDVFAANCPTGMSCATKGLGAYCYDDGM